jgi:hypothetical protein
MLEEEVDSIYRNELAISESRWSHLSHKTMWKVLLYNLFQGLTNSKHSFNAISSNECCEWIECLSSAIIVAIVKVKLSPMKLTITFQNFMYTGYNCHDDINNFLYSTMQFLLF